MLVRGTIDLDRTFVHWDYNAAKVKQLLIDHPEVVVEIPGPPFYLLRSTDATTSVRALCKHYKIETNREYIHRSRRGLNRMRTTGEYPKAVAPPPPPAPIEFTAQHFTLSLDPTTCNATMEWTSSVGAAFRTRQTSEPQPFVSLYNKVADAQATNLEACAGVALVSRNATAALLRVSARHGYGTLDLSVSVHDALVTITVADARAWHADPVERHLGFGEWWAGLLTNSTAPIVMGRLQGPRATPGPTAIAGAPSAGFMTISNATCSLRDRGRHAATHRRHRIKYRLSRLTIK